MWTLPWCFYVPESPFLHPRTPDSRHRLYPRTQAAARLRGSGSAATRSPGCPVLSLPCSSYPAALLHIHLASSTCQPFLVKRCKTHNEQEARFERQYFQFAAPLLVSSPVVLFCSKDLVTAGTAARWKYHQPDASSAPMKPLLNKNTNHRFTLE